MGVRSGVRIALELMLLTMLVLHYSVQIIIASGPFAGLYHPLLASFTDRVGPFSYASVLVAPNTAIFE